jgi:acetyltransferase-like isoleucine patch superfamily enzyme
MRRLTSEKLGSGNSLRHWWKAKNPLRVSFNFLLIYSAKYLPSLALKRAFYRLAGARVGRDVSVGLGAVLDVFFPELVEIGDNTIIGYNATILAHEFLVPELRTGPVRIGRDVMVGANSTILAGVEIGDGAVVSACSLVNRDVPPGAFAAGVPAKIIKQKRRNV